MKTLPIVLFGSIAIILITSCAKKPDVSKNNEQAVCVKTESVAETTANIQINCSGILSSKRISKLSFKTGGIINHIWVKEGQTVKKGDLLATLDDTEISAQVQQANVGYEKTLRDVNRAKNLYADTVITLEQLQNVTSAYEAALETKNIAEFNFRYSRITAPSEGEIIGKIAEENELVSPGMPIVIFSENGTNEWIIKTGIADRDAVSINLNDEASVTFDAFGGKIFQARVSQLAQTADPASGTFEIELTVKPGEAKFINGLVANAKINSSEKHKVSLLPPDAVTEADGNKGYVYVVAPNHTTARKVPVTIAYVENSKIAVIEPFNNLEKVITKGTAYISDGSRINIVQ